MPDQSWASSPGVRASMQSNRGRDTKPELALRSAVHALGLRYRVNARPLTAVRRTADLVFGPTRVAVFLDGCFWHGCPDHHTVAATNSGFWAEKVETNRRRDADTDRRLEESGWLSVRVWEHEDPQQAAERVRDLVIKRRKEQRAPPAPGGRFRDRRSSVGGDLVTARPRAARPLVRGASRE